MGCGSRMVRTFAQGELSIFKHADCEVPAVGNESALWNFVQMPCVVGSRAYGLESATSDVDRRGFYLPPARKVAVTAAYEMGGIV